MTTAPLSGSSTATAPFRHRTTLGRVTETHTKAPSSFPPSKEFAAQANARDDLYQQAEQDRLAFWAEQANRLSWDTPFSEVLDWSDRPFAKWFTDGKLNVTYNCVDRHVEAGNGGRVAIYWEGERIGEDRTLTYTDLQDAVSRAANALTDLGLVAGDRVAIYLPMIPEAVVAMLACARLGVLHSVVFAGFTATALGARIDDAQAKLLITADGQFRRGKPASLKEAADQAVADADSIEHVLVVRRTGADIPWTEGRDVWWHDVVDSALPEHRAEAFDAEHPLFLLYTSGTTGKPKGIVHTSGGYLTQASYTQHHIFDIKPESDVFWCTADIGWVTGHTYSVYGPLSNGITQVIYEGTPDTPDQHRHFQIIEKYGVTIYYTAPTMIRTFMKWGREIPDAHDLSSLRLLGTVGEPINPQAWRWYRKVLGGDTVPVVDTWWQTETGAAMISPLPGVGARYDADGAIWILGRIDDVMNVSGHRISTAEVESALVGHSGVAEAAVVGAHDETTGQAICAFVVLQADHAETTGAEIIDELRAEVARVISPIARPRELHVVPELPKTRSGKIMRRLLRDIAEKRDLGDTSTLLDPGVFDAIRAAQ